MTFQTPLLNIAAISDVDDFLSLESNSPSICHMQPKSFYFISDVSSLAIPILPFRFPDISMTLQNAFMVFALRCTVRFFTIFVDLDAHTLRHNVVWLKAIDER